MQRFGVLGFPVHHSLSPLLYRSAFAAYDLPYMFDAIEVDSSVFHDFLSHADASWKGFAVTMPHKLQALHYAQHATHISTCIGSANTLWRNSQGEWCADNTDVLGISGALDYVGLEPIRELGSDSCSFAISQENVPKKKILILGAGGTARAVIYTIKDYTQEVIIACRTPSKAHELVVLAQKLGLVSSAVAIQNTDLELLCSEVEIVISTLPKGVTDPYAPAVSLAPRYCDVLYHPWPTYTMQYCREHSATQVVGGLTMLLYQAYAQFKILTGLTPPTTVMAQTLANHTHTPLSDIIKE